MGPLGSYGEYFGFRENCHNLALLVLYHKPEVGSKREMLVWAARRLGLEAGMEDTALAEFPDGCS